ncbi:unnamed protein product [Pleuronectes platessa]|uniref:Uncharacterized protein n=1 Tax=Pleuronectes platessa TaxID=8262 RepID=A0A9N7VK93_PLEPL|nr:unnamed protein product [Pleuronectes platessa]
MLGTQPPRHRHDAEAGPCCSIRCSTGNPGSQLAHAGTSREDNWRKITVQAQSDGKYGNQAVDGRTAVFYPCFRKLPQFD